MRTLLVALLAIAANPQSSEACAQLAEANTLLGWSSDGTLALHAHVDGDKITHAEILPTRYEGWKYIIAPSGDEVHVRKISVASCAVLEKADSIVVERVKGELNEASLNKLTVVEGLRLIEPPTDDGGASELSARFSGKNRYAAHSVQINRGTATVATLPVPVWCVGSCIRDEKWRSWGAKITKTVTVGDRTLYVVRMSRVCNKGNGKDMWIERVIAAPGDEPRPARGRCRGSGGG